MAAWERIEDGDQRRRSFKTFEEPPGLGALTAPLGPPFADQSDQPIRTEPSIREGGKIAVGILNISPEFLKNAAAHRSVLGQVRE